MSKLGNSIYSSFQFSEDFNVEAGATLSIMSGLVEASGSFLYFQDVSSSSRTNEILHKTTVSTGAQSLDLNNAQLADIVRYHDQGEWTHLVVGVEFGGSIVISVQ